MVTWKERVWLSGGKKEEEAAENCVQSLPAMMLLLAVAMLAIVVAVLGLLVLGRLVLAVKDDWRDLYSPIFEGEPFRIAEASSMCCARIRNCDDRKAAMAG
jgi:hypothetical protein